ncbi:hypothetical protein NDN08_007449 [Rhodosorus marinus]|uniref:Alanine--tRNA ligase n=1 Tax=Rhodosorus marinus TaxID=101924 RepID=A0AAV8UXK6_9RHOD|nr:hypothetical protein NDN08_007449 [Rhodosorus marinus]
MSLSGLEIRDKFLSFFESKEHKKLPSASLIPEDPTIIMTIAGMVPFKPIFLGQVEAEFPRATTSQKCVRTNDIENVGVTNRHHTFFEMLGNFSFGDYFKTEAIQWSWELLTKVYEIPESRLAVSVFRDDDESYEIWRDLVKVPESRIQRLGEEDNFWKSGPTGPCGPCTEIYYDFNPESEEKIDLEDDSRFIEVYNLVFMQSNRDANGDLTPLKKQNIDTGMGLERMAQVLQKTPNNYETDLILPIISKAAEIAGRNYDKEEHRMKTSLKVVGDHTRAVMHMTADGIRASNVGRGYILRRLIRRIVRHGRLLGIERPFIGEVLEVSSRLAIEAGFNNVEEQAEVIRKEISREESRFLATLERGESKLQDVLEDAKSSGDLVSGADAFELYDTFGFPLELTEEAAVEVGLKVDVEGFQSKMQEQKDRARAARGETDLTSATVYAELSQTTGGTEFLGYEQTYSKKCTVSGVVSRSGGELVEEAEEGERVSLILDRTPFYAEGGGQVGDIGVLKSSSGLVEVSDVKREAGAWVHIGTVTSGSVLVGDDVEGVVDAQRRRKIKAHHTATHLLQAALKKLVSGEISQAGSLVDDVRLRFDFNCSRPLAPEELDEVERTVNQWITEEHDTVVFYTSLEDAIERGAIAMFGEKYDKSEVRVVDVPGVSMELCGGTHVPNTTDIGLFKIVSESGIAAGVRRIEAVCGTAVMPYLSSRDIAVKDLCLNLKVKPEELVARVSILQDELKSKQKEVANLKAQVAVASSLALAQHAQDLGGLKVLVSKIEGEVDAEGLKAAAESLSEELGREEAVVVLVSSPGEGKVALVAQAGKDAVRQGVHAGKLIGPIAKICKGGGGGKPALAQAGGKDPSKIDEALQAAKVKLGETLAVEAGT